MPKPAARRGRRAYDVVLFGATGFTGTLTAEYLARNAPATCRWALAGRNLDKLGAVRDRLAEIDPRHAEAPLVQADVTDADSLRGLAESARVVLTTVGPYIEHGEPLVAACAEAGTDYVDLTGEGEFVNLMYVRHHAKAVETGARLVHACGFDSIPYDLGVLFTVGQLPTGEPIHVDGYVTAGGRPSGGTYQTAVTAMSRMVESQRAAKERRGVEGRPTGRRGRAVQGRPGWSADADAWVLPLPTIDPSIVARSARALGNYGPDFSYSHYAAFKRLPTAAASLVGTGAAFAMAQLPPTRQWLMGRIDRGEGPSPDQRAKSWFKVRFVGRGGGHKVVTQVSGGDPGYDETAKMVTESALCLAFDDNPPTAGQVTTAQAMGEALTRRLMAAGIRFEVLESGPESRDA